MAMLSQAEAWELDRGIKNMTETLDGGEFDEEGFDAALETLSTQTADYIDQIGSLVSRVRRSPKSAQEIEAQEKSGPRPVHAHAEMHIEADSDDEVNDPSYEMEESEADSDEDIQSNVSSMLRSALSISFDPEDVPSVMRLAVADIESAILGEDGASDDELFESASGSDHDELHSAYDEEMHEEDPVEEEQPSTRHHSTESGQTEKDTEALQAAPLPKLYIPEIVSGPCFRCKVCGLQLAPEQELCSKRFQGPHGPAMLFRHVINVDISRVAWTKFLTGYHRIAQVTCAGCSKEHGWIYFQSFESSESYKEGKYVLENCTFFY